MVAVFENVGGRQLDLNLTVMKTGGRIALCGNISQYNSADLYGIKNIVNVTRLQLRIQGFIVFSFKEQYSDALREIRNWLQQGKFHRQYQMVEGGLVSVSLVLSSSPEFWLQIKAPEALCDLFVGKNLGKMIVKASE